MVSAGREVGGVREEGGGGGWGRVGGHRQEGRGVFFEWSRERIKALLWRCRQGFTALWPWRETMSTELEHWFTTPLYSLRKDVVNQWLEFVFCVPPSVNTRYTKYKLQPLVYDILPQWIQGTQNTNSNHWFTTSFLSEYKVHKLQTPSTGLRHPPSSHCHIWLRYRFRKTVSNVSEYKVHKTRTPSTGLRHPFFNHCHNW